MSKATSLGVGELNLTIQALKNEVKHLKEGKKIRKMTRPEGVTIPPQERNGHDSKMALIMEWRLLGRTETLKVGGCKQLSAFDSALELELSDATSLLLSRVK